MLCTEEVSGNSSPKLSSDPTNLQEGTRAVAQEIGFILVGANREDGPFRFAIVFKHAGRSMSSILYHNATTGQVIHGWAISCTVMTLCGFMTFYDEFCSRAKRWTCRDLSDIIMTCHHVAGNSVVSGSTLTTPLL